MPSGLLAFSPSPFVFHLSVYIYRCVLRSLPSIQLNTSDPSVTMRFNFLTTIVAALASFGLAESNLPGNPNDQSLNPRLTTVPLAARDLPTGTCNSGTPCANGACCSKTNLCGYSKDFCGAGCQHNCEFRSPSAVDPQLTKHS